MMATTHMLAGMVLGVSVMVLAPELVAIALLAGLVGGLFPDLDLYFNHRKTLHYPGGYSLAAVAAVVAATLVPTAWSVALAIGFTAAAVHCVMDVFGGGLELEPWNATSDRGVYSHIQGRWLPPRRWVPYDGSIEDLGLASFIALPILVVIDGPFQDLVIGLLLVSVVYTVLRRRLATVARQVVPFVPEGLHEHVPARYRVDL